MSVENPSIQDPEGYKPIELEFHDGHLWMPDGTMFQPDFEVGSERHQIDLFIEYERTFGRGKAFKITHRIPVAIADPRIMIREVGSPENYYELTNEYENIARKIQHLTSQGSLEETREMITRLKQFRKKYPLLYTDADENTGPGHL